MSAMLGVDLGERRIGIAICDTAGLMARPLVTVRRGADLATDVAMLRELVERHDVREVVVGLPLEARGHHGPQAERTVAWADAIGPALPAGTRVTFQDERLSSDLAERRLGPMPRGRSGGPPTRTQREAYRAKVDREAATIILQDALDARSAAAAASPTPTTVETRS
jgi:putative Holliday junction resolvase